MKTAKRGSSPAGLRRVWPGGWRGSAVGILLWASVATLSPAAATALHGGAASESRLAGVEVQIRRPGDRFSVDVGGVLDTANTFSWSHGGGSFAAQTMHSVALRNLGRRPIRNPRLVVNGKGRWWKVREVVEEAIAGAETEQEKALRLWYHLARHRYHFKSGLPRGEVADAFRQFASYGYSTCGRVGLATIPFFRAAGFAGEKPEESPFLRLMNGHIQGEVFVDGRPQYLDIDARLFALDRDNRRPVGGDELAEDHDLLVRQLPWGPSSQIARQHQKAAWFGADDGRYYPEPGIWQEEPEFLLRPGEEVTFSWAPAEKWVGHRPPLASNGRIEWRPLEARLPVVRMVERSAGFVQEGARLVAVAERARAIFSTATPWTQVGGKLGITVGMNPKQGHSSGSCRVLHSFNRKDWEPLWIGLSGAPETRLRLDLDEVFEKPGRPKRARRKWWLQIFCRGAPGAEIRDLVFETDVLTAPATLPALSTGANRVVYEADTQRPNELRVRMRWREWSDVEVPAPPREPRFPEDGAPARTSFLRFSWPEDPAVESWHLIVSPRGDLAYPLRAGHDVVVGDAFYEMPFRGLFSHGETYFWRVRPRSSDGVWGAWSPTWSFRWAGPMAPVQPRWEPVDGRLELVWAPNPGGEAPVRYRVYGSNDRGFTVEAPAGSFAAGETAGNRMVVAGPRLPGDGYNRAFYRVVAIDEKGVESGPSEYVELPRPFLFARPKKIARAGSSYRGRVRSLVSRGDLQRRETRAGRASYAFWDREEAVYQLVSGPAWLELEPDNGRLSGTPGAADVGRNPIEVRVELHRPHAAEAAAFATGPAPSAEPRSAVFSFDLWVLEPAGETRISSGGRAARASEAPAL